MLYFFFFFLSEECALIVQFTGIFPRKTSYQLLSTENTLKKKKKKEDLSYSFLSLSLFLSL